MQIRGDKTTILEHKILPTNNERQSETLPNIINFVIHIIVSAIYYCTDK